MFNRSKIELLTYDNDAKGAKNMAIEYDKLMNIGIPVIEQEYSEKDVILYALGIGVGSNNDIDQELNFVYEKKLKVVPTFPVILSNPNMWVRDLDTGIDYRHVLHGEQRLTLHSNIPAHGKVIGKTSVVDIVDKGIGKGALVYYDREIIEKETGNLLATVGFTIFCRADGGFGGPSEQKRRPHPLPSRAPDNIIDHKSIPQSALIYRLSGDLNPLHVDPQAAADAGFAKPILHGLGTYGISGYAILKSACGYDPSKLLSIDCRFTAPAYPGETIRTEIWIDGTIVSFRASVLERETVVISNGRAELRY